MRIRIRINNYWSGSRCLKPFGSGSGSGSGRLLLRFNLLLMAGWAVDRAADGRCGRHRYGHAGQPRGTAQQVGRDVVYLCWPIASSYTSPRGSQRDVVYLCWPIAPSYTSPRGSQRDVVYLCWPIAPSYTSPRGSQRDVVYLCWPMASSYIRVPGGHKEMSSILTDQ